MHWWVKTREQLFKLIEEAGTEPVNVNWAWKDLGWKLEDDFQPEECDFNRTDGGNILTYIKEAAQYICEKNVLVASGRSRSSLKTAWNHI